MAELIGKYSNGSPIQRETETYATCAQCGEYTYSIDKFICLPCLHASTDYMEEE